MNRTSCNNEKVYFSGLLPKRCPKTFSAVTAALDRSGVPWGLLDGTRDIWCRDYMPVEIFPGHYVAFGYNPDYLNDSKAHRETITDSMEVCRRLDLSRLLDSREILVDGGNIVRCATRTIMTAKVFEDNPHYSVSDLSARLERMLGADITFLPWDMDEIYGHADGLVRFIDPETVLMTNYSQLDPDMAYRFNKVLKARFKTVRELKYKVERPYRNNWAYINFLQTQKVLLLPKFGVPEDEQAFEQFSKYFPEYRGRIEMVDARDLVVHGGCLNCASWVIRNESSLEVPRADKIAGSTELR